MAFTVETGVGVANANSYIAEAFFRAFHADRGSDVTALTQVQVETACVRASDYIDKRFGTRFRGLRLIREQGLEWPRMDAFDDDGFQLVEVPVQLAKATAEYALRAHGYVTLAPDPALPFSTRDALGSGTTTTAGQVKKRFEKIGPIEREITFSDTEGGSNDVSSGSSIVSGSYIPAYPGADLLIEELIESSVSRETVRA